MATTSAASSVTSQHPRLASTTADVRFRELQIPNNKHASDKLTVKQSPLGGQPEFLLGNSVTGLGQWKSGIWNTTWNQHLLFCGSHDFKHLVDRNRELKAPVLFLPSADWIRWVMLADQSLRNSRGTVTWKSVLSTDRKYQRIPFSFWTMSMKKDSLLTAKNKRKVEGYQAVSKRPFEFTAQNQQMSKETLWGAFLNRAGALCCNSIHLPLQD